MKSRKSSQNPASAKASSSNRPVGAKKSPGKTSPKKNRKTPVAKSQVKTKGSSQVSAISPKGKKQSDKMKPIQKGREKANSSRPKAATQSEKAVEARKISRTNSKAEAKARAKSKPTQSKRSSTDKERNQTGISKSPDSRKRTSNKSAAKEKKLPEVPRILLEGDYPETSRLTGPGARFVTADKASLTSGSSDLAELPKSYGTKALFVVARDPEWLYASWDFSREQLKTHNKLSKNGHLVLRVYPESTRSQPISEVGVHPESTHWFLHVGPRGGSPRYQVEIGYYNRSGNWKRATLAEPVSMPSMERHEAENLSFVTLVSRARAERGESPVTPSVRSKITNLRSEVPSMGREVSADSQPTGHSVSSTLAATTQTYPPGPWSEEQEMALAQVVSMQEVRRHWIGSLEMIEMMESHAAESLSSMELSGREKPESVSGGAISSPAPKPGEKRGFWMNVNAELIVYGATDPAAQVSIGDRPIQLRKDGTFSYRFALPDGVYGLPITAVSPDKVELREAILHFSRKTDYQGHVEPHPQDRTLKTPHKDNLT